MSKLKWDFKFETSNTLCKCLARTLDMVLTPICGCACVIFFLFFFFFLQCAHIPLLTTDFFHGPNSYMWLCVWNKLLVQNVEFTILSINMNFTSPSSLGSLEKIITTIKGSHFGRPNPKEPCLNKLKVQNDTILVYSQSSYMVRQWTISLTCHIPLTLSHMQVKRGRKCQVTLLFINI